MDKIKSLLKGRKKGTKDKGSKGDKDGPKVDLEASTAYAAGAASLATTSSYEGIETGSDYVTTDTNVQNTSPAMSFPLVVVAIDFGTTYSGYAFAFKWSSGKIQANTGWNAGKLMSLKTPTSVLLNPEGQFASFGFEAEDTYARLAEVEEHNQWRLFRHFKMELHRNRSLSLDCIINDVAGRPMSALPIFTMAIQYLRDHMLNTVNLQIVAVKETDVLYVLTVPAIWADSAKQFMREAAIRAGIDPTRLKLALEPEAAGIWCSEVNKVVPGRNEDSDWLTCPHMVVDLGGGTADISVQKRLSDGRIKLLHKPSGGPWGGTCVDNNFLNTISEIFGKNVLERWKSEYMEDYFELLREFETKKRGFGIGVARTVTIRCSISLTNITEEMTGQSIKERIDTSSYKNDIVFHNDKWRIQFECVRGWFESPVECILKHVQSILNEHPTVQSILLVGGFSECKYVQRRFGEELSSKRLIVPDEAGISILKGAVMFGFHPDVISSRVMGFTYGMAVNDQRKTDLFSVFVRVGDEIDLRQEIVRRDYVLCEHNSTHINIYRSSEINPKYVFEGNCELLGELKIAHPPEISQEIRHRLIDVSFRFGDTELSVKITMKVTGRVENMHMDCLHTSN